MARNVRKMACSPADVFEILRDGWIYPSWVVGASRMRDVDAEWPSPRARLRHSFGVWPLLVNDETVVETLEPERRFVARVKGWPIGAARVTIDVAPVYGGCVVRLREVPIAGPVRWAPRLIIDLLLLWRNRETVHRLALLAEGRARSRG